MEIERACDRLFSSDENFSENATKFLSLLSQLKDESLFETLSTIFTQLSTSDEINKGISDNLKKV